MKKMKKMLFSPKGTAVLFLLAAVLLLGSSVGGARAALTYFSETYSSRVQMYDIGVSLVERTEGNEAEDVSWRNYESDSNGAWDEATGVLLTKLLAGEPDGKLKLGKTYGEELSVRNSGTINQFVRVTIYKYWLLPGEEGPEAAPETQKAPQLDPAMIELHLLCDGTGANNGWMLDEGASTDERTVLYYSQLLHSETEGGGPSASVPFTDTIRINGGIATKVHQTVAPSAQGGGYTDLTTVYDYDGAQFCVEARVDAVQEHNAEDAAWSAWGRRIQVSGETMSLE